MERFRIGICDDETMDLALTMELIKQYDGNQQLQILPFLRASDLLEECVRNPLDIVLLDIEMPPPSGFDIAKELITLPKPPTIIFATKSNAYTLKGYGIAIRYLQKPLAYEPFCEAMDAAIEEAITHRLTIQIDSTTHAIRLHDVTYIEIFGHYLVIHTSNKSYRVRSTLKEIIAKLPRGYFVPSHKSFIVNLEHVRSVTASEVFLDCNVVIPIGRTKAQEFTQALYRFLGR